MTTNGTTPTCTADSERITPDYRTLLDSNQWSSAIEQNYYPNVYGALFGIHNTSDCHLDIWKSILNVPHPHEPGDGALESADQLTVTVTVTSRSNPSAIAPESDPKVVATSTADQTVTIQKPPQAPLPTHYVPRPTPSVTIEGPVSITSSSATEGGGSETQIESEPLHLVATSLTMAGKSAHLLPLSDHSIGVQIVHLTSMTELFDTSASPKSADLELIVGTQTLVAGGPAVTISGTPISLDSHATALLIGSSALPIHPVPFSTLDGHGLAPDGSTLVIPEAPISLVGGAVSFQVGASSLPNFPPPAFTFADSMYTEILNVGFIIGTQILVPGGPAITISGTPISLNPQATALVIGSSTLPIDPVPFITPISSAPLDSHALAFVIGTQTLVPGGPAITISNAPLSLAAETARLQDSPSSLRTILPPVLMLAGSVYTEIPTIGFIIGAQTLVPGGSAIIVDGTRLSLAPGATEIIIGSKTEFFQSTPTLGSPTASGFTGPSGIAQVTAVATGTGPVGSVPSIGRAEKLETGRCRWIIVEALVLAFTMAVIFSL